MNVIDKEIDILNKILNRMNIKGFHFVNNFNRISLCIPREQTSMRTIMTILLEFGVHYHRYSLDIIALQFVIC